MTENEAIKELQDYIDLPFGIYISEETAKMAIKALEEVQQYRQIGTVEKCREAVEKQTVKRAWHISPVDDNDNANVECPDCHATTDYAVNVIKRGHCWKCGQLLDWSDND